MMSVVKLTNPVDAIGNAIADPLEQVAKDLKQLSDLHATANEHLKQSGHDLAVTMGKDIAQPLTDMINKQYNFAAGINKGINEIADLYNEAAQVIRTAAHWIDPILNVAFDLLQWAVDRLTADIVVRQGQSAVQAIFDDLRNQINRAESDAGSFFGDLFHLDLGAALHDAEDEGKALLHIAGDALAMVATVEPLLCQWAEDIFQAVNWCFNQIQSVLLGIVDWVFGLSDIVSEAVVFTDPNSTDAEKWIAGGELVLNIGLDIIMLIPGAQEAIFGKIAEKLGIEFLTRWLATKIAESIVAQVIKDFVERLMTKFAESVVERALEKKLTQEVFKSIQGAIEEKLRSAIQSIMKDYLAGNISFTEALARIKALQTLGDRFSSEELKVLFKRFEADDLVKIAKYNIKLEDINKVIKDSNKDFPLTDTNAINALIGPEGTKGVQIAGKGTAGADINFYDANGNLIGRRELKCILGKSQGSFNDYVLHAGLDQVQTVGKDAAKEILIQLPAGTTEEDAATRLARMRGGDQVKRLTTAEKNELKNVRIIIVDPSGKQLADEPVLP